MLFIFVSQLKQAEAALKAEDEEIEEVREEFTVRVTATEKKYQAAAKVSWCCSREYSFPSHIPVYFCSFLQDLSLDFRPSNLPCLRICTEFPWLILGTGNSKELAACLVYNIIETKIFIALSKMET